MAELSKNIQKYEKQFGILAIQKGFISQDELMEALNIQVNEDMEGLKHRLIGEILLDIDYITAGKIQEILNIMFSKQI